MLPRPCAALRDGSTNGAGARLLGVDLSPQSALKNPRMVFVTTLLLFIVIIIMYTYIYMVPRPPIDLPFCFF